MGEGSVTPGSTNSADTVVRKTLGDSRLESEKQVAPEIASKENEPKDGALRNMNQESGETQLDLVALEKKRQSQDYPDWDDDPVNPLNWSNKKKWTNTLIVSLSAFTATAASSMVAPANQIISEHFGETNRQVPILMVSLYVIGLGIGPFFYTPIAELYGRQAAYLSSTIPFCLFNAACCLAPNMRTLLVLRFFAGFCGCTGPGLGMATVSDMFSKRERGTPVSLYALGPMAGPVGGSMLGFWLSLAGWRWIFGFLGILSLVTCLQCVVFLKETYPPVLKYKLAYLRARSPESVNTELRGLADKSKWSWIIALVQNVKAGPVFKAALTRPPRLLFGNPVALIFATYYAYVYAIIYVQIVSLPTLFKSDPYDLKLFHYNWPQSTAGLSFLGLWFGFVTAAITAANVQNRIYAYLCKRNGDKGQPEYRLVLTQIGMIIFPVGFFIYGWCAEKQTHFMGPIVGLALLGMGLMLAFNSIQTFIIDFTAPYSASGIAGATFMRSVVACLLPLWSDQMFEAWGWGIGSTFLACCAIIVIPAPLIMFKYGKKLRDRFVFTG